MRFEIGDATVEFKLTGLQKRMLAAGNSVTVNLYPEPDQREYTAGDMGFTTPNRVHVDSANHPHPPVDTKRIADYINGGFRYKDTSTDVNYSFKGTDPELVKLYTGIDPELDPKYDPVERPEHYVDGREIEPIDVIDDWPLGFYEGQVLKYISRAGRKTNSELEDLRKAKFYLDRLVRLVAEDEGGENDRT